MKLNQDKINTLLNTYNKKQDSEYMKVSMESFIKEAKRYVKAIKERRMICNIGKVSASGMSRNIKFLEMAKCKTYDKKTRYGLSNFYQFFNVMQYTPVKDSDYFRIGGCGMDMIFHTNYTIIHNLQYLGLISKKDCESLAQATPAII